MDQMLRPLTSTGRPRLWFLAVLPFASATALAQAPQSTGSSPVAETLRARVSSQPDDASAWRLFGRTLLQEKDLAGARDALHRAAELDPLSAAAQFDLGQALLQLGRPDEAAVHLRRAIELAPESDYAAEAEAVLQTLVAGDDMLAAGFEFTPLEASELFEKDESLVAPQPRGVSRRFYSRVKAGVLYNTNVSLAPISRNLFRGPRESFQAFLAPELEYDFVKNGAWWAGALFVGRFTLNEGDLQQFNLQSYQPGLFLERAFDADSAVLIPRLQYDFSHDEFHGDTFGNRHALTASATALWDHGNDSSIFWTVENTNFASDGILPEITSRDGWTNILGVSHTIYPAHRFLYLVRGGVDVQRTVTDGTDFSFNGVNLFGEALIPIAPLVELELEAGWGYRDYFDHEFRPPRNEHIWRTAAELRKWFSENLAGAAIVSYDRFDSRSRAFDAERLVTGLVVTYQY